MKYCTYCGATLDPNATFCTSCGIALSDQKATPPTADEPKTEVCKKCGTPLNASSEFCTSCGAPVHSSSREATTQMGERAEKPKKSSTVAIVAVICVAIVIVVGIICYTVYMNSTEQQDSVIIVANTNTNANNTNSNTNKNTNTNSNSNKNTNTNTNKNTNTNTNDNYTVAKVDVSATTSSGKTVSGTVKRTGTDSSGRMCVLPNSSTTTYSTSDLKNLSDVELAIARNEIYARHGYKFKNSGMYSYFSNYFKNYSGTVTDQANVSLNSTEKKNVETIRSIEDDRGSQWLSLKES